MFFPPCFHADAEITIWGPASPEALLEDRIARYISAPLSPVEVRELPCSVSFRDTPPSEWRDRVGDDRLRGGQPPRAHARLPDHRGRHDHLLHPGPRARPRDGARERRSGVDLRLRLGPRRGPSDPRLPVLRRRVPRPRRLGPLRHERRAHLRLACRRPPGAPLPPRPAARRRLPRPPACVGARERWETLGGDPTLVEMAMEGGELEVSPAPTGAGIPA